MNQNNIDIDDSLLDKQIQDSSVSGLSFVCADNEYKFRGVLKRLLPYLGTNEGKIILAQVMIILKLEGILGKTYSDHDKKMVKSIHDSIMRAPSKKSEALSYARKLLLDES